MIKIIAGSKQGISIAMPKKELTRPMMQRIKESIFQIIEINYFSFDNIDVADIFAGSGSLGFESLSRGAKSVSFVEKSSIAAKVIKDNNKKLLFENVNIVNKSAEFFISKTDKKFDLIFLDPPFPCHNKEISNLLTLIAEKNILKNNGVIILRRSKKSEILELNDSNYNIRIKKYGDSLIYLIAKK